MSQTCKWEKTCAEGFAEAGNRDQVTWGRQTQYLCSTFRTQTEILKRMTRTEEAEKKKRFAEDQFQVILIFEFVIIQCCVHLTWDLSWCVRGVRGRDIQKWWTGPVGLKVAVELWNQTQCKTLKHSLSFSVIHTTHTNTHTITEFNEAFPLCEGTWPVGALCLHSRHNAVCGSWSASLTVSCTSSLVLLSRQTYILSLNRILNMSQRLS